MWKIGTSACRATRRTYSGTLAQKLASMNLRPSKDFATFIARVQDVGQVGKIVFGGRRRPDVDARLTRQARICPSEMQPERQGVALL
jgi:hypothetical protein